MSAQDPSDDSRIRSAILDHVRSVWRDSTIAEETWGQGPIERNVPGLRILKATPTAVQSPVVYVSDGCFVSEPAEHIRHEFFIISPSQERRHVETLTMLANFHADERYRLDVGSVVDIGHAWMPGSRCNHLLMSLPYPYGPKLEWLQLPDICVRFLWALPITQREADFAGANGIEALEQEFDAVHLDYIDPSRSSVV